MSAVLSNTVTVIIPVFNGLPFLPEAVASVLEQTDKDFRLHLVDDGSTDGSYRYLETLRDDRILIFRNPVNRGLYGSLLRHIERVETAWIVILMQDDLLKPRYLTEMRSLSERHRGVLALWPESSWIDARGRLLSRGRDTRREERIDPGPQTWRSVLQRGCIWTISGSMTATRLFVAEQFRADLPHRGDFEWFLRVVRRYPAVYFETPLVTQRRHDGQASAINLATAKDFTEAAAILLEQVHQHEQDVSWWWMIRLLTKQYGLILRRALGYVRRGRLNMVTTLVPAIRDFGACFCRVSFRAR